ncbi:MAG: diacylglycerol kinase family lipid kinase [Bacillota bacterium]|nr:diacylglycerol kinase family lipid kinase [Bacillota bacterium]
MKHIFIVNPAAGGGKAESKFLPMIIDACKAANVDYEIHRSLNKNDITSWVRQRAITGEPARFYACGGDGTVNDVMSGLVGYDKAELAIIPCGTGNDFVKNWTNNKKNLLIQELMNGKVIPVDVIQYKDSFAINMINIGADCDVVVEAKNLQNLHGAAAYLVGALKVLPKGPVYRMRYSIDDEPEVEGDFLLMCIANGVYCGGGFKSCPIASVQDKLIDVCLVKPVGGPKIVPLMLKYRAGKHLTDPELQDLIIYRQCRSFKLTALKPVNLSKDGEVEEFDQAEFKIYPNSVNLVIPQSSELISK